MWISYVVVAVLFFALGVYAVFLLRREQAKSRKDRDRLTMQDNILQGKTFPALEAANQAVEASQNLIFAIQQTLIGKGKP